MTKKVGVIEACQVDLPSGSADLQWTSSNEESHRMRAG